MPHETVFIRSGDENVRVLRRCHQEEPELREVLPNHGAACHQLPQYDSCKPFIPRSNHRREVVPEAIIDGDPEKIVKRQTQQQEVRL